MSNIENLLAQKFIARRDVKAIQHRDGTWSPHTVSGRRDGEYIPWRRRDLEAHVSGSATYGHYLLDTDNTCKLLAFDIDLEKTGFWPEEDYLGTSDDIPKPIEFNPREAWLDRNHPARRWMKWQFRYVANLFMYAIHTYLDIPCAAAYSGGKGIHVYGFFEEEPMQASDARRTMQGIIDRIGENPKVKGKNRHLEPLAGKNFYRFQDQDHWTGFPNFSIETFPKQDTLEGGDGLGNLMRLPLGRNLKSNDPTFFMDMTSPPGIMRPIDPEFALTTKDPWSRPGE